MDIGTGSFVGMRILPSGTPGATDSDSDETPMIDTEEPIEIKGASIVAITRKVSSTSLQWSGASNNVDFATRVGHGKVRPN